MRPSAWLCAAVAVLPLLAACSGGDDPAPPPNCGAASSLTTTLAGGNGQDGNMFDVVALAGVRVTGLTAMLSPGTTNARVEVYHRGGTYVGHEAVSADWTPAGAVTVDAAATGPTALPLALDIPIAPGARHAFYVTTNGAGVDYTNGTTEGAVAAQDARIQVLEGRGVEYPFGLTFVPRIYNGTVTYRPCD